MLETATGGAAAATPADTALRNIADLPGPRGWPILGNAPQIHFPRLHLHLEQWAREYGPYYRIHLGGPILVVADHVASAKIMRDRPEGFRRTTRLEQVGMDMGLKPGVFGAEGEAWKRQRRMVMTGFDPTHVKSYYPALLKVADRLQARWARAAAAGRTIELQPELMRFTVDAIAGLAFGTDVNTLESDDDVIQRHLDKIFPKLFSRILSPFPYWRYIKLPSDHALDRALAAVDQAVAGFISAARARLAADAARRADPPNLLEVMIVAADSEGSGIDDAQVAGNVLTMLLAGEDTTANTLAWMIHLLWRNPQQLALAKGEVRRVVGDGRAITTAQLAELDFIEACAHETMRLKPVAPQLPLQALADTVVGNVRVPKGSVVINLLRSDSVDERHVPNALAFQPQRWLAAADASLQATSTKRVSMPFGGGPRICPGRYLALLEMKLAMAMLLSRFDITSVDTPDGQEAAEHLSFTMTPVGLSMKLQPRN